MRITEAAKSLGTSPRMLRYRESLGLLPALQAGRRGHRQFTHRDVDAVAAALALERRFDISPAALAFGLRVLAEPAVRAAVADLGERTGRIGRARALDFEQERALRMLGARPPQEAQPRQGAAVRTTPSLVEPGRGQRGHPRARDGTST
jgi:MerR family transcriptional regulator, copper efflux regulator